MFERPTKGDLDRSLSLLMHDARHKLLNEVNRIKSDAAKAGALQSNRVIVAAVKVADTLHQDAMKQATSTLLDFIERMQQPPAEVTGWGRPHLENLGNSLLGCIPPNGFPADHQRIRAQYQAVFQQRLDGVLRDVEIGLVKGTGFASAESVERKEEWISAAEAIQMLRPTMNPLIAHQSICARAHSCLIRARAERYMVDSRGADNCEVPKEFWWAEGGAALEQNWTTGDFETWINQRQHLRAFGVSFLRADIEKMLPPGLAKPSAAPAAPVAAKEGRSAIILTALDIETRAILRHVSDIGEQTARGGTVFHVGHFGQWEVAVAECGEGNVHAGAIAERGIAAFQAEVALFVGIAGGVKDVAIGDALVSSKVYGYERGKDTDEGFKPRPVVNLSDHALEQRARAIRQSNIWIRRLNPELQHSNPRIFVGAIAAGEKVVASSAGKVAAFLREHYSDTLGIEMEGHGFLATLHINAPARGCVVRGISDLLDGKDDADKAGSQERAADVASAVAFEMLATLGSGEKNVGEKINASETNFHQPQSARNERTDAALTYFAPELARTIARQVHVLDRAIANFIVASVGNQPLPGDTWASLKPAQPVQYPNAPEFRNLLPTDAVLLIEFYDSLQEIADTIRSWIEEQTPPDVNAWNALMQMMQNNLRIGQRAVTRFCPDKQYSAISPAGGTLFDQSTRAVSSGDTALQAHLVRRGAA